MVMDGDAAGLAGPGLRRLGYLVAASGADLVRLPRLDEKARRLPAAVALNRDKRTCSRKRDDVGLALHSRAGHVIAVIRIHDQELPVFANRRPVGCELFDEMVAEVD